MGDSRITQGSPEDRPASLERRRWHAPQFFVTEFAATVNVTNGQGDGHTTAAPSSS
jgi:hypothetical protein